MTRWDDVGPISQGKILTAILQDHEDEAARMLSGWSVIDLDALEYAAGKLSLLCRQAIIRSAYVRRQP